MASPPAQRELAPPPMPSRSRAADGPIPGEANYPDPGMAPTPSPEPQQPHHNPAANLAAIIAQRTGTMSPTAGDKGLASPSLPTTSRPQYTPDASDDDNDAPPPPMPQRPQSQSRSQSQSYPSPRPTQQPRFAEPPLIRNATSHPPSHSPPPRSPGGAFHLYHLHEVIPHMGKNKKLPTVLGINVGRGLLTLAPEKAKDGPTQEWTAEKLAHYSIEGKHVFVELVRPSKSVDFHAGAKDTAREIVEMLGEIAGMVRVGGQMGEVVEAANRGTGRGGAGGAKRGRMVYGFAAQGDDEVSVGVDEEVVVLDDVASEEWWKVRRVRGGQVGVVPSSYVEITGMAESESMGGGANAGRSTVEQNRAEEARLARDAAHR
ncbi:cytoskeletal protein binding protein, partial [Teratosphaeriaceae sp. CCFEE 6253]